MKPGRSGSLATSMEFRSSSLDAWHLSRTNGLPAGLKIAPTSRRSARSDQLRRLIPGVAQRVQAALRALRIPGHAQRPPMQNDLVREENPVLPGDRKSTRLNSSHLGISYAVFCLKKKKNT